MLKHSLTCLTVVSSVSGPAPTAVPVDVVNTMSTVTAGVGRTLVDVWCDGKRWCVGEYIAHNAY